MELVANIHISAGTASNFANWRPGVLRCDDDGVASLERGKDALEELGIDEMASVAISSHLIGADDVLIATKSGGAWSIRVSGGEKLVEALRALGVPVGSR
jgi:hypothetical protein